MDEKKPRSFLLNNPRLERETVVEIVGRSIRRTQEELEEGQRRPCCWPGCKHRERTGR